VKPLVQHASGKIRSHYFLSQDEQLRRLLAELTLLRRRTNAAEASSEMAKTQLSEQMITLRAEMERTLTEQATAARSQQSALSAQLARSEQTRSDERTALSRERDTLAVHLEHSKVELAQLRAEYQTALAERDEARLNFDVHCRCILDS
jgi:hypothetical protein